MDRDEVKVILKRKIWEIFDEPELQERGYLGDETISLMAESALSVLLAVEDIQSYLKNEGILE